jgi:hypothetical protein
MDTQDVDLAGSRLRDREHDDFCRDLDALFELRTRRGFSARHRRACSVRAVMGRAVSARRVEPTINSPPSSPPSQ